MPIICHRQAYRLIRRKCISCPKPIKGGGYNGVMMEDSPGAQRLDFQAQKDMTTDVVNNKSTVVTNEHSETVEKAFFFARYYSARKS